MGYEHYNDTDRPIDHIDKKPSDPYGIQSTKIDSGIRKTLNTCQYWIKGLPGVCEYWSPGDPGKCGYSLYPLPSGWNNGACDKVGRQYGCDKYYLVNESDEDLDQYVCIATCPQRSGLYKRDHKDDPWRAVKASEIRGYNADSEFVGRCDGCGFGRGELGHTFSNGGKLCESEEFRKLPSICNYYRPYHISFGAIIPKTSTLIGDTKIKRDKKTGRIVGDERPSFEPRLPFSFQIYNIRAALHKCAWWDKDTASDFMYDTAGLYLDGGDKCINPSELVLPFHSDGYHLGPEMLLENVWSEAGTIICNGARSDCPGYTGRWIYCVDEYMEKGDKISAQQILELRFWFQEWSSQLEYDSVFRGPPNKSDPDTSDIYTYHKWDSISAESTTSVLLGKRCTLCIPTGNEFVKTALQVEELVFKQPGTAVPSTKLELHTEKPTAQTSLKADETNYPQVEFPNLIRELPRDVPNPLNIVYPYKVRDPWDDKDPCDIDNDPEPCIKKYYSIEGNYISVVGSAIRHQDIYLFNMTTLEKQTLIPIPEHIEKQYTRLGIKGGAIQQIEFDEEMDDFISLLDKNMLVHKSESDEFGLFVLGPIKIEYNKLNELVVCYSYDDEWEFRKRSVWSHFNGGLITQTGFEHEYPDEGAYIDDGYSRFTPPAKAAAEFTAFCKDIYDLKTEIGDVLKCSKKISYSSVTDYFYRYDFCIKKVSVVGFESDRWLRANNAGSIWVEIEDIDLNYIFNWGVTKAAVKVELDPDRDEFDKSVYYDGVEFEVILPNSTNTQSTIPPNACLLTPKNGEIISIFRCNIDGSRNKVYIKIDYWYTYISSNKSTYDNEEIIYPDFSDAINKFSPGKHELQVSRGPDGKILDFKFENIIDDTMSVMALFVDEENRIVSTFATKLFVSVPRVLCRDVEIRYGWKADYTKYKLLPQKGFLRLDQDGPFGLVSAGSSEWGSVIPCGDHELGMFSNTGPMWFPYNDCETVDFYDVWTGANGVVSPHEDTPRYDYRFMTPIENIPFCAPTATHWDCTEDWGCGHHKISANSIRFSGAAKYRGYINPLEYYAFGWQLPKFGNSLREYVERFVSMDNDQHISYAGAFPSISRAWMPFVMDNTCFLYDFSSFDKNSNEITYLNQFNFMFTEGEVIEVIERSGGGNSGAVIQSEYKRYRFEDLFDIRRLILSSYPPPIIQESGLSFPFVAFYCFKDDATQWAWQERWLPIERGVPEEVLGFVDLDRPTYLYDYNKKEHRLIMDENKEEIITFFPPEKKFEDGKLTLIRWPGIKISDGPTRWFKCLYNSYDGSLIDWADENEGLVDGSGGAGDGAGNIYEQCTTSGAWIHAHPDKFPGLENMLFDKNFASSPKDASDDGREIKVSYSDVLDETEKYVYNRGLIASIGKDRLLYMPYYCGFWFCLSAEDVCYLPTSVNPPPNLYDAATWAWANTTKAVIERGIYIAPECLCEVRVYGISGEVLASDKHVQILGDEDNYKLFHFSRPTIRVSENDSGVVIGAYEGWYDDSKNYLAWKAVIKIPVTPDRALTDDGITRKIKLEFMSSGGAIGIDRIEFFYGEYMEAEETFSVYERKYLRSTGKYGDYNPDGPKRVLLYEHNRDNSGVYWNQVAAPQDEFISYGKMRRVSGSEMHGDGERLPPITSYGKLLETESKQQELYEDALAYDDNDETLYEPILPPIWSDHFENMGLPPNYSPEHVVFVSEKRKWKNHPDTIGYETYPTWSPKGQYYRWSAQFRLAKCYIIDTFHKIAQLEFHNVAEDEVIYATFAAQVYWGLRSWHMDLKVEKNLFLGSSDAARQADETQSRGFWDLVTGGR